MVDDAESLVTLTPQAFREERNIDARVLHEVTELDLEKRRVHVRQLEGKKEWWEPFDQLMIATGAVPIRPDVPGADARGIYGVHTLQSGIEVRQAVDKEKPKRAVIIGGGYIGLEMAEAFVRRGMEVTMVERAPQVMLTLDPDMGELVSEALTAAGVTLYREESLQGFEADKGRVQAVVTDKRTVPADIVILGMGVRPQATLAQGTSIALGEKGAIVVNERMQTSVEGIWAAGDCVQSFHLVSRKPVYIALATIANKQGHVAGVNMGGSSATFPGVLGTAVTKIYTVEVARTGLQEREIKQLNGEYVSGKIESRTRAGYYPEAGPITVKVFAEKGSGRLLGGQIVGQEGSGKRIDILATALYAGLTVPEMVNLDLSYAPPYSPVWDPVLIAARQTARLI
jgi:NADPH-dependent 2,4-dienoyl-CoA reductase/sulfur reductase-like enzyme